MDTHTLPHIQADDPMSFYSVVKARNSCYTDRKWNACVQFEAEIRQLAGANSNFSVIKEFRSSRY